MALYESFEPIFQFPEHGNRNDDKLSRSCLLYTSTVILALETGISDVVFLKIRSVVRELHQYVWTIVPCSCCPQLLFREVVYLVKVFYGAPVRILVSAGELVGPADNCADRFAGVG